MSFTPNANGPRGFDVAKARDGTPQRSIDARISGAGATKFHVGQPVGIDTNGLLIELADDANQVYGVFDGCQFEAVNGDVVFSPYWPAPGAVKTGTTVKARVYPATGLFLIKANAALAQSNIGQYFALTPSTVGAGGSDATGRSSVQLDVATANAAATGLLVQLVEISPREEGGDEVGSLAIVQFIRPQQTADVA
jgi:hypothetical protein